LLQGVDDPADVVVGVLQGARIDLHLAFQDGLDLLGHVVPGRYLVVAGGQVGVGANDAEFLLPGKSDLALGVPAVRELAPVFIGPLFRHMMRGVRRAGREVHEERLVRHEGLLGANPVDGMIGQVLSQVVALLRRRRWLDRIQALIQGRIVLVVLAADEPVEILETAAA
jgi:hypothetical protein